MDSKCCIVPLPECDPGLRAAGSGRGASAGAALFLLGWALFGKSEDNWYVSILNSLEIDESLLSLPKMELFLLFTVPAVLFSPAGEELFFRGIFHASVAEQWGGRTAAWINGQAFAGIRLLHHGLLIDGSGVHVRWFQARCGSP
jgi:hypothetical protein